MIVDKVDRPLVIDLTGPEGNAFCLMGYAKKFARQLDLDANQIIEEIFSLSKKLAIRKSVSSCLVPNLRESL